MSRPEKWKDEFISIAKGAYQLGATDQELADMLDVSVRTIYNWRASKPGFAEALAVGKEIADERVIHSLYQKAVGYEQDAVKIFMPAGSSEPIYAEYREKIAPDTTAAIFWLKNRRPSDWRDKVSVVGGGDGDEPIKHSIVLTDEQLAKIALGK